MLGPGWNHQPVFVLSHVVTALWQWPKWTLTRWPWNRVFLGMFTCPMLGYFGWMQSLLYQTHEHDLIKPMIWIPRGAGKMLFWMRPSRFTNGRLVIPSWGDKFASELALFSIDFLYICLWLFRKNVIKCKCAMCFSNEFTLRRDPMVTGLPLCALCLGTLSLTNQPILATELTHKSLSGWSCSHHFVSGLLKPHLGRSTSQLGSTRAFWEHVRVLKFARKWSTSAHSEFIRNSLKNLKRHDLATGAIFR